MRRISFFLIILVTILIGSSVYAETIFPGETFGYGRTEKLPINFSKIPTVNSTDNWITNIGVLANVDAVQFNNEGGTLTISETYLRSFGDGEWLQLDGGNSPSASINWDGFNIDNIGNATIIDRLFLTNEGHWIKIGADGFDGLSTEAFSLQHSEESEAGTITFIVSFNKTNSDIDGISIMAQAGLNNSGGYLGNSWMIAPNNLTNNLTDLSNCFFVINATGNTPRISCDTDDTGADFFVQDDIQLGGTLFADGGIRAETLVNFIMNGEDVNIQNGSLHIFTPVTFEQGVVEGNEITVFIEDFTGGLGSFTNLQSDLGNWFPTANILCDDGDCANSVGISGVGNIIMEANISTVNINSTSLNFIYSLSNMIGANDFEVTVNNNVGSGEVSIFTDSTNNVIKSSQSIALPDSMSDQPKVSIRFNCDVTNANRQCFVDTISVNGTAIATTLTNVSGFDSVIKFGDGSLASDGFPEKGIFYVAENDTIVIRGNATFENVIEQDLNITNSIELNGTTIFDWAGVLTSPNFPSFLLANGSTPLTGDWEAGGFTIISASADFESIIVDDISEKTPGNGVIFGSNVDLGSNNFATSGSLSAGSLSVGSVSSSLVPSGVSNLGSAVLEWQNLYIDGIIFTDEIRNIGPLFTGATTISEDNDGGDTTLIIKNTAGTGSTDETVSIQGQTTTTPFPMSKIVFGRIGTYSGPVGKKSFIDFYTERETEDTRKVLRMDDNQDAWWEGSVNIDGNNEKLFLGEGQEVSIYYDGTNAVFETESGNSTFIFRNQSAGNFADLLANSYLTATSVFDKSKGNALDLVYDADYYKDGEVINKSRFYGYNIISVTDFSRFEINESTNETYYPYKTTQEVISLNDEIDLLRQGLYEIIIWITGIEEEIDDLEQENIRIKNCVKENPIDYLKYATCINSA